jgi:hypothetical protein
MKAMLDNEKIENKPLKKRKPPENIPGGFLQLVFQVYSLRLWKCSNTIIEQYFAVGSIMNT